MTCRDRTLRSVLLMSALIGCAAALACGGGGGGGGGGVVVPPGLTASFDGSNDTPSGATLSMQPGSASGDTFSVQILVTDINDFFGAGFRVTFNPATAVFTGSSSAGAFIEEAGITTQYNAEVLGGSPGTVLVAATRVGSSVTGVDSGQEALLITLNFRATATTGANAFSFGSPADREVTTCATAGQPCTTLADASLTWSGGTMVAN